MGAKRLSPQGIEAIVAVYNFVGHSNGQDKAVMTDKSSR